MRESASYCFLARATSIVQTEVNESHTIQRSHPGQQTEFAQRYWVQRKLMVTFPGAVFYGTSVEIAGSGGTVRTDPERNV